MKIMTKTLVIDVWSDVVCPFCYIGKRQLEAAIAGLHEEEQGLIDIQWHSYQLDPQARPAPGLTVFEYLALKKGISVDQSRIMHQQVDSMARSVGLHYNYDTMVVANTSKAHRLIQAAKQAELQGPLEEVLFDGYFISGKDLNNDDTLIDLAGKAGMDQDFARAALVDGDGSLARLVEADVQEGLRLGCRGVPYFVLQGKQATSGAQGVEAIRRTIRGALATLN